MTSSFFIFKRGKVKGKEVQVHRAGQKGGMQRCATPREIFPRCGGQWRWRGHPS